jgi:hypothetical protein
MKLTTIKHNEQNRMFGVRVGTYEGRAYARIDLWFVSFRVTKG